MQIVDHRTFERNVTRLPDRAQARATVALQLLASVMQPPKICASGATVEDIVAYKEFFETTMKVMLDYVEEALNGPSGLNANLELGTTVKTEEFFDGCRELISDLAHAIEMRADPMYGKMWR